MHFTVAICIRNLIHGVNLASKHTRVDIHQLLIYSPQH
ncbi:hypothetical protein BGLA2_140024 [Burkholderia gladioli]|nr:hypothetical protein BGLA2_140024 [Burkholderia gladioli]